MPYVNLKLYPGRTEQQKQEVARRIAEVVAEVCKVADPAATSVVIEEVAREDWERTVQPEIDARSANQFYP